MTSSTANERDWLIQVLTRDIPLGAAMAIEISRLDERGIALRLPLQPNINDKGTAFGGAMASAMILAGWSLPRLLLKRADLKAELVIGRCELRFLLPVSTDFEVSCDWPPAADCASFIEAVQARGRARLRVTPRCEAGGELVASLDGRYAALVNHP